MRSNREYSTGEHERARRGEPEETSPETEANHRQLLDWLITAEDGQAAAPLTVGPR